MCTSSMANHRYSFTIYIISIRMEHSQQRQTNLYGPHPYIPSLITHIILNTPLNLHKTHHHKAYAKPRQQQISLPTMIWSDMAEEQARRIMAYVRPSGSEGRYTRVDLAQIIDFVIDLEQFNIKQRTLRSGKAITSEIVHLTIEADRQQIDWKCQVDDMEHQLRQHPEVLKL
jgi:hypothetical protein